MANLKPYDKKVLICQHDWKLENNIFFCKKCGVEKEELKKIKNLSLIKSLNEWV